MEYTTGEKELYDLRVDSYELENVVANAQYSTIVEGLAQSTASLKGLAITTAALPSGTVGLPYTFQLGAWGGTLPYAWSILQGTLPAGLTLDGVSGVIQGIPVSSDTQRVLFSVHDASIATQTQEPQRFVRSFFLVMVAPGFLHAEPVFSKERTMPLDVEDDDEDPGSE